MQAGPNIYDGRQDAYRAWELAVELAREGHPGLRAWFAGARSQEPGARDVYIMPNAGSLAESGTGNDGATDVAAVAEHAPVAAMVALWRPTRPAPRRDRPGESRPDDNPARQRENTREALLIDMLRRPEGATIAQIMAITGWQAHTCRGILRRRT